MARSPHYKGNNEGGYGNPPVKNQFDGEPGPGRPKGSKNSIDAALRKVYSEPMEVIDKKTGKLRKVDPNMAIAVRSAQLGMSGRSHDNSRAIELARKYGPDSENAAGTIQQDLSVLSEAELFLYGIISARVCNGSFAEIELGRRQEMIDFGKSFVEWGQSLGLDVQSLEEMLDREQGDRHEQGIA